MRCEADASELMLCIIPGNLVRKHDRYGWLEYKIVFQTEASRFWKAYLREFVTFYLEFYLFS